MCGPSGGGGGRESKKAPGWSHRSLYMLHVLPTLSRALLLRFPSFLPTPAPTPWHILSSFPCTLVANVSLLELSQHFIASALGALSSLHEARNTARFPRVGAP